MGVLKDKLYHSGNNYIATIKVEKGGWSWIEKVVPEDNMKELIGNLGAILAIYVMKDEEKLPQHLCGGEFTCSLNLNQFFFKFLRYSPKHLCS